MTPQSPAGSSRDDAAQQQSPQQAGGALEGAISSIELSGLTLKLVTERGETLQLTVRTHAAHSATADVYASNYAFAS